MKLEARPSVSSPTLAQFGPLQAALDWFNERLFDGELSPAFLSMNKKPKSIGYFRANAYEAPDGSRVSCINIDPRAHVALDARKTLAILVHEQCHQWVHEMELPKGPGGHGLEWRKAMESRGLPPVAVSASWHRASHTIEEGGLFDLAFRAMPEEMQLPFAEVIHTSSRRKSDRVKKTCPRCHRNAWMAPSYEASCTRCSKETGQLIELVQATTN